MNSRFAILNPCPKHWADLSGDGRQRQCDTCGITVHAIEQYSAEEWDQVRCESPGRVCGFLSGESPTEPRGRRDVLAGALLTAISPLFAQTGRVRIRVTDAGGAVVTTAEASLLGRDDKRTRKALANHAGEMAWTDFPVGDCRFAIVAPGFKTRLLTVTVRNGDEVKIDATLELGTVGEMVMVESAPLKSRPSSKPTKRRRWLIFF